MKIPTLQLGFIFHESSSALDPARIKLAFEYTLLRNLYGALLEYDIDNRLVAAVPESFSTSDREIRFKFGRKVTTVDGHVITAEDAEASLKRLMALGKSGHNDIRRFVCPGYVLNSLEEDCPGIRVEKNELILTVTNSSQIAQLLPALESADFSIVPKSNIAGPSEKFALKGHKNTSGPYYILEDSVNGAFKLQANPNHYLYDPQMPQTVQLVPVQRLEGIDLLAAGTIDALPTTQPYWGSKATQLLERNDFNIHETMPLMVTFLQFSPRAMNQFSADQRFFAAKVAGEAFEETFAKAGGKPTDQFFQSLSEGSLDSDQLEELRGLKKMKSPPEFSKPIELGVGPSFIEIFSRALAPFPQVKVVEINHHRIYNEPASRPHMLFGTTDSAWTEDVNLIGYSFETGQFALPGLDTEAWLMKYINTQEKQSRIKMLNQLHFDVLRNALIVPTTSAPYFAVSKKSWQLNQSPFGAGFRLWRMRHN